MEIKTASVSVHPFCMLLPAITPEEYEALKASIQEKGQLEPILRYEGMVLDGRHRYRILEELGIEPVYEEFLGDDKSARDRVLGRMLSRQLTKAQRAMIAAKAATALVGRPVKSPPEENIIPESPMTSGEAAKQMHVSKGHVDRAKSIKSPLLQDAVRDSVITIGAAIKLDCLSDEDQQDAIDEIQAGKNLKDSDNDKVKAAFTPNGSAPKVYKDKYVVKCFDQICRLVGERAKQHGSSAAHKKVKEDLNTFMVDFKAWVSQENAPF